MRKVKKSYGIACGRYNLQRRRYEMILVKNRYTYYYVEFILGHYSKNNTSRLQYLFDNMTVHEKIDILSFNFGQMWYRIWLINPDYMCTGKHIGYEKNKNAFHNNFDFDKDKLRNLIKRSKSVDTHWEIPKGRKNPQEPEMVCAKREFTEETGVTSYEIIPRVSFNETIRNTKARYIHTYYVATSRVKCLKIDFSTSQVSEICDVRWMGISDVNDAKIEDLMRKVFNLLKSQKLGARTELLG